MNSKQILIQLCKYKENEISLKLNEPANYFTKDDELKIKGWSIMSCDKILNTIRQTFKDSMINDSSICPWCVRHRDEDEDSIDCHDCSYALNHKSCSSLYSTYSKLHTKLGVFYKFLDEDVMLEIISQTNQKNFAVYVPTPEISSMVQKKLIDLGFSWPIEPINEVKYTEYPCIWTISGNTLQWGTKAQFTTKKREGKELSVYDVLNEDHWIPKKSTWTPKPVKQKPTKSDTIADIIKRFSNEYQPGREIIMNDVLKNMKHDDLLFQLKKLENA